ncbi:hypothetical protein HDU96_005477 [Phlyctochytrium bullatum]|nr:hypothetical protein HDU96_005477 [Phlyctochytrium bullatum]
MTNRLARSAAPPSTTNPPPPPHPNPTTWQQTGPPLKRQRDQEPSPTSLDRSSRPRLPSTTSHHTTTTNAFTQSRDTPTSLSPPQTMSSSRPPFDPADDLLAQDLSHPMDTIFDSVFLNAIGGDTPNDGFSPPHGSTASYMDVQEMLPLDDLDYPAPPPAAAAAPQAPAVPPTPTPAIAWDTATAADPALTPAVSPAAVLGSDNASLASDESDASQQDHPELAYVTDEAGNILSLQEDEWNMFILRNTVVPVPPHVQRCLSPNIIGRNLFEFISDRKVQAFSRHIVYMLCSGQQQKFHHWFCDSPDVERKMFMTVTALTGHGSSKLILWVSKILSEKVLKLPQNYLSSPALTTADDDEPASLFGSTPTAVASAPTSSRGGSSVAGRTTSSATNSATLVGPPSAFPAPTDDPSGPPTNTVCSFCKRIMVMCEDLAPEAVATILAASTVLPKPLQAHGAVPILGLRGKLGEQVQLSTQAGVVNHLWLTPHQYYVVAGKGGDIRIRHGVCEVCYNEIGMTFYPPGTFRDGQPVAAAKAVAAREEAERRAVGRNRGRGKGKARVGPSAAVAKKKAAAPPAAAPTPAATRVPPAQQQGRAGVVVVPPPAGDATSPASRSGSSSAGGSSPPRAVQAEAVDPEKHGVMGPPAAPAGADKAQERAAEAAWREQRRRTGFGEICGWVAKGALPKLETRIPPGYVAITVMASNGISGSSSSSSTSLGLGDNVPVLVDIGEEPSSSSSSSSSTASVPSYHTADANPPSAYNRFMRHELPRLKAENPTLSHKDVFVMAAKLWKTSLHNPANVPAPVRNPVLIDIGDEPGAVPVGDEIAMVTGVGKAVEARGVGEEGNGGEGLPSFGEAVGVDGVGGVVGAVGALEEGTAVEPPNYFDISVIPDQFLLMRSYLDRASVATCAIDAKGVSSDDPILQANPDELFRFFMTHLHDEYDYAARPRLSVKVKGSHKETVTTPQMRVGSDGSTSVSMKTETKTVVDFSLDIDVSALVCPIWEHVFAVQPGTRARQRKWSPLAKHFLEVEGLTQEDRASWRQILEQFTRSKNVLKEIHLTKEIMWDYETLESSIENAIRATGYVYPVEITFDRTFDKISVYAATRLSKAFRSWWFWVLLIVTFLWIPVLPLYYLLRLKLDDQMVAQYEMKVDERTFYEKNATAIMMAVRERATDVRIRAVV